MWKQSVSLCNSAAYLTLSILAYTCIPGGWKSCMPVPKSKFSSRRPPKSHQTHLNSRPQARASWVLAKDHGQTRGEGLFELVSRNCTMRLYAHSEPAYESCSWLDSSCVSSLWSWRNVRPATKNAINIHKPTPSPWIGLGLQNDTKIAPLDPTGGGFSWIPNPSLACTAKCAKERRNCSSWGVGL